MELKAVLNSPYTKEEKNKFIIEENHQKGYKIEETSKGLEAWGHTSEEIEQFKKARLAKRSLTKREVFLALYRDKGITPEQIRAKIEDTEASIEFDYATEYYRGNPLIDQVGAILGYSSEDLDYLFEHKELPPKS